jgi:hypothetical protein
MIRIRIEYLLHRDHIEQPRTRIELESRPPARHAGQSQCPAQAPAVTVRPGPSPPWCQCPDRVLSTVTVSLLIGVPYAMIRVMRVRAESVGYDS